MAKEQDFDQTLPQKHSSKMNRNTMGCTNLVKKVHIYPRDHLWNRLNETRWKVNSNRQTSSQTIAHELNKPQHNKEHQNCWKQKPHNHRSKGTNFTQDQQKGNLLQNPVHPMWSMERFNNCHGQNIKYKITSLN
jgi:hypothetical protein